MLRASRATRALRSLALVAAVSALANGLAGASLADVDDLAGTLAEFADEPAEHQALASYYRDKAKAARAEAERHRSMGKHYAGGKLVQVQAMKEHCEKLATLSDQAAGQFDMLAEMHEKMAKSG